MFCVTYLVSMFVYQLQSCNLNCDMWQLPGEIIRKIWAMGSKLNFLIYFLVTSISLYFLSKKFYPKSLVSPLVPVIKSPAGSVNGALILSKYGRKISAYRQSIYIRTVSFLAILKYGYLHLFPFWLTWGRNQMYCACCSTQTAHKPVLTGSAK